MHHAYLQLLEGQLQPLSERFGVGFSGGLALQDVRRPLVLLEGMPELDLASAVPLVALFVFMLLLSAYRIVPYEHVHSNKV